MRDFALMCLALVMVVIFAPVAFVVQSVRYPVMRKPLSDLWFSVAIGLDQLGGSILYAEPDWTISSRTWWLADRGNRWAGGFERVINLFFGADHCRRSYQHEFGNKTIATG